MIICDTIAASQEPFWHNWASCLERLVCPNIIGTFRLFRWWLCQIS